jgi:hypothetical protein
LRLIYHIVVDHPRPIRSECSCKIRTAEAWYVSRHIHFTRVIDTGLRLIGRGDLTPRRMRVYANRANIVDFSDVDETQPSIDISLLEGETGVTEYPLRAATFASINSLSIFFVSVLKIPLIMPTNGPMT